MKVIPAHAPAPGRFLRRETVMGTVFSFDVRIEVTEAAGADDEAQRHLGRAVDDAVAWLHWVDATFSTYQHGSEVNRFDRGEISAGECSPELRHVIAMCHRYHEATSGYFDAWALGHFDPSGVVKGWSAEKASLMLARRGFIDHIIDAGGDVVLSGFPGPGRLWRTAVKHPTVPRAFCAALGTGPGAIATSGTYERGHHVINPMTGRPNTDLISVTVVGPGMADADAFATAAVAMGSGAPGWLATLDGYESQVVSSAGRAWETPGFRSLSVIRNGAGRSLDTGP